MKRTLFAIVIVVLLSLMFARHSGRGRSLLQFANYAYGPFFIMPSYVDGWQLVLQTIFIAVLFALVVNIPWPHRKRMTQIKRVYEVRPRKDHRGVDLFSVVS